MQLTDCLNYVLPVFRGRARGAMPSCLQQLRTPHRPMQSAQTALRLFLCTTLSSQFTSGRSRALLQPHTRRPWLGPAQLSAQPAAARLARGARLKHRNLQLPSGRKRTLHEIYNPYEYVYMLLIIWESYNSYKGFQNATVLLYL